MRSPKISKSEDVRYHGSAGKRGEGRGGQKGDKKKLGYLIFFTVFQYKVDIASTCNNSRMVWNGDLFP